VGGFSIRDPVQVIFLLASFVIATTIHEFMHAYTGAYLGDDTAARLGRITLNPMMHFEPIGFIGMVLISLGFPAIGWGKPVPVNVNRLRGQFRGRKTGMAIVALAGPISNVVQAAVASIPFWLSGGIVADSPLTEFLLSYIFVNLLLASFNMIPVPPLDGSRLLAAILPRFWQPYLISLERYGIMVIFLLAILGGQLGGSITGAMYGPVYELLLGVITNDGSF